MRDEPIANNGGEEEGAPLWVVTFGDLMSLLMCFFVLLLSFSEMDRKKYKVVSGSMRNAFGIQRKKPVFESPKGQKMISKEFEQAIIQTKIEDAVKPIQEELETRKLVERAKEILMRRRGLDGEEAFRWIQKRSMTTRKSKRIVAEAILLSEEIEG